MMAILKIIAGLWRNETFELKERGEAIAIGRENVDIVLKDKSASRRHAKLACKQGQWILEDLKSSNGTFVNEKRIFQPVTLKHNDQIRCGTTVMLFDTQVSQENESYNVPVSAEDDFAFAPGETVVGFEFSGVGINSVSLQLYEKIGKAIEKYSDETKLLESAINAVGEHIPSQCRFVLLKESSGQKLITVVEHHDLDTADTGVVIDSNLVETVMAENRTLVVGDVSEYKSTNKTKAVAKSNVKSVLCAPVRTGKHMLGVIYLAVIEKDVYTKGHAKMLDQAAMEIALALENIRLNQMVTQSERFTVAGQTAVSLSHGIKNVLQAVAGGREVVDHGFKTGDIDRAKRGWNILKRNLDKIRGLVLDMLEFSKESKPVLSNCRLNNLIESVIETLRPQTDKKNVSVVLQMDDRIGVVQLDADKIYDVILNLLLNAIDAVAEQTGLINVSTELDQENGNLLLRINDNGPGIEDTHAIFLPFHTSKGKLGTGLGLPIARKIVSQHGGTIQVQSKIGEGSLFTVTLPAKS